MTRLSALLVGLVAVLEPSLDVLASSSPEPVAESWSYTYSYLSSDYAQYQEFSGISDASGNLYWLACTMTGRSGWLYLRECRLRSTDFDGNLRYEVFIGSGILGDFFSFRLHLVAGSVVVAEHSALLLGFDTSTGSVVWTRDLRDESRLIRGLAYDGDGRLIVTTASSVQALSADDGTTIWRRDLHSEDPERIASLRTVVLDEGRNVYFGWDLCRPPPLEDCETTIVSLQPDGSPRFETRVDPNAAPMAVAHGRLLIGETRWVETGLAELLDAETGARLPGFLAGMTPTANALGLISNELGFYIQQVSANDVALAAFDLVSGAIRWRFRLDTFFSSARTALINNSGNILILNKGSLLEISPQGQVLQTVFLRTSARTFDSNGNSLLLNGRWFSQFLGTVSAYDLPGAPGEGRLGWNARQGNAQGENRPREE
jgi:outer membrane protein assembly factor BamB